MAHYSQKDAIVPYPIVFLTRFYNFFRYSENLFQNQFFFMDMPTFFRKKFWGHSMFSVTLKWNRPLKMQNRFVFPSSVQIHVYECEWNCKTLWNLGTALYRPCNLLNIFWIKSHNKSISLILLLLIHERECIITLINW